MKWKKKKMFIHEWQGVFIYSEYHVDIAQTSFNWMYWINLLFISFHFFFYFFLFFTSLFSLFFLLLLLLLLLFHKSIRIEIIIDAIWFVKWITRWLGFFILSTSACRYMWRIQYCIMNVLLWWWDQPHWMTGKHVAYKIALRTQTSARLNKQHTQTITMSPCQIEATRLMTCLQLN